MPRMRHVLWWAILITFVGCQAPRGPLVVEDPDPSIKIPAMKKVVRLKDRKQVHKLIEQLNSDDAAVRFYAIDSLKDLTGETLGYVYYQDEDARKPAIAKWKAWLAEHDPSSTQPQPSAGGGKK